MKKAIPAALGVLVLLLASACGGPDLTKSEVKISKSIATAISKPDDALLTKKQARCVSDKFVADVGEKKLKSKKVVGDDGSYNANGANVDKKISNLFSKALLDCVDEKKALKAYETTVNKAISNSASSQLSKKDVACFADKFVKTAGVKRLLSSQVITDSGALNTSAASLDKKTAGNYADALLGCLDYRKVLAEQAADADKTVDVDKLVACYKSSISADEIRALMVATQTQSPDAQALSAATQKKAEDCAKESKKKK
jgi:hypothetical protein